MAEVQISPDYVAFLDVTPTKILPLRHSFNHVQHNFEDGRVRTQNLSSVKYDIELQWDYISSADLETILDWYHNDSKANGMARTFYWRHPRTEILYVARFLGPLRTSYEPGFLQSINKIPMRVVPA
jgi:hypothetical protein